MANYLAMSSEELVEEQQKLRVEYQTYKNMGLNLNMDRGKPCTEQLDLSKEMLKMDNYIGEDGFDRCGVYRGQRHGYPGLLYPDRADYPAGGSLPKETAAFDDPVYTV